MPRRANDPSLLRAQAQSGRDGEQAYKVAQSQLAQQRQAAVRQAMQEAALRGAPAGALAQVQNQVAQPYNQAITQTTQEGARYGSQLAAGRSRMSDYNAAVLEARKLIPGQVQQAVAPIRAQNRFQLQSLRMEGQNRVAEIERQTELIMAQMAAAAQASRLGADGNAPTLTQSEMAAALETGGADWLSQLQSQAQQIVERNQAGIAQDPNVQQAQGTATGAALATMYGGGVYDYDQSPKQGSESDRVNAALANMPGQIGQGSESDRLNTALGNMPGQSESDRLSAAIGNVPGIGQQAEQAGPPRPSYEDAMQDLMAEYTQAQDAAQQSIRPYYGATGYLTPRNLNQLTRRYGDVAVPLGQYAQENPIGGGREVAEVVGGQPTTAGEFRPEATESFRQAMEYAASQLAKQGYSFGGPEVQLGMAQNQGQTLGNYEALQRGELPLIQQVANARKAAEEQAAAAQKAAEDEYTYGRQQASDVRSEDSAARAAENEIESDTAAAAAEDRRNAAAAEAKTKSDALAELAVMGIHWTPDLGPYKMVLEQVKDPAFGLGPAINKIDAWLEEHAESDGYDIDRALDESQIFSAQLRRLIKAIYG